MGDIYIIGKDSVPQTIALGKGESLQMTLLILPGVDCSVPVRIDLDGEGASADIAGLYLSTGSQKVDISIDLRHNVGGCTSSQLFKGIASGCSRASFYGKVLVCRDAQQTKALQTNNNILLSREALVQTRPQLEIYADDVECSHGATTGFLNEDELFYMRSRGVPEKEARKLQMISFLAPVLARVDDESLCAEVVASLEGMLA